MKSTIIRSLHGVLLVCIGGCCFSNSAFAEGEWLDYAPQFAVALAQPLKIVGCKLEAATGCILNTNEKISAQCGTHTIAITGVQKTHKRGEEETTHVVLQLDDNQHKTVSTTLSAEDFPAEFVDGVQFADLNGDGKDDFILNLSYHGVGLAAEHTGTVYLLSSASGYSYLTLSGMNHVPRYLRFDNNLQSVLVLQRMGGANSDREGEWIRTLDNKPHTFFVFDLLQFDAAAPKGAKLSNSLDTRFPFWTLFTYSPTHAETNLLSPATKKSLWQDPLLNEIFGKMVERGY